MRIASALRLLLAALALSLLASCSLALNLDACTDNDDCDGDSLCSVDNLCVSANEEENNGGQDGLTGGPCQQLLGAAEEEDAFLIGLILQLSESGGGFGRPMLDAIELAMNDINGIGGIDGRRIGLIACDTQGVDTLAEEGAQHLIQAGVSAIIGMNSSQVIDIGPDLIVPAEVLLMSPSATAMTITNLNDNDLIWRTAPSDESQAQAMSGLVDHILDEVLPAEGITDAKVTLLVRRQDRWATGLRDHLITSLPQAITEGGEERFSVHDFANIGAGEPSDYSGTASAVATEVEEPDLVIVLGSADSWELISNLEIALQEKTPLYLGGDAMKNAGAAAEADASLEGRVWGTGPRNVAESGYEPYLTFRVKFQSAGLGNPDNFQFVANAFDALYALAFAAASEGFTGPELAIGLTRQAEGQDIDPVSTDAQDALAILSGGGTINYRGASGPLNFDAKGDPQPLPIALWCFENGQVPEHGELFDIETGFTPLTCQDSED